MSEIKTNKISPRKGTTQTIGDSGDTVTIPSGVTLSNAGSISGIQKIDWDTTKKTTAFTAVNQTGYFVDTTSAAITVTFPASPSAGNVIGIKDYANTFDTNNLTINPNGNKIQGSTNNFIISVEGTAANFIYVDSTRGWVLTDASKASDISESATFISATGGTITTCGDYKIHTFTGPGTFCVASVGNCATPTTYRDKIEYLVIAGGAAGGSNDHYSTAIGGGGAGGYRESSGASGGCYATSPLGNCVAALTVTATAYPVTVGAGGSSPTLSPGCNPNNRSNSNPGSNSVLSIITSAGGAGGAAGQDTPIPGASPFNGNSRSGGSGGGGALGLPGIYTGAPGGSGNTPPVSPSQGNPGGNGAAHPVVQSTNGGSGGGGGAGAAGGNASYQPCFSGAGGNGVATSITGSSVTRAGGGGGSQGGTYPGGTGPQTFGAGGSGGGGAGAPFPKGNGGSGTANTGSGGGAGAGYIHPSQPYPTPSESRGGSGGSGIVVIRYKYQ